MIVPIYPPLDGGAAERFPAFASSLGAAQAVDDRDAMAALTARELDWCRDAGQSPRQKRVYEACIRVLADLTNLRWRIVERGFGFALENPKETVRGRTTGELVASKDAMRAQLRAVVDEQLSQPSVREFVRRMEAGARGKESVGMLVADGAELAVRLGPAAALAGAERLDALRDAVRPYLQLATEDRDPITGQSLREIWRYFRYSWSIPQVAVPGRQLLYLVRDAGHPHHPVMGIASLNNCPLEMGEVRETYIGWHRAALGLRFQDATAAGEEALVAEVDWLEGRIATSLGEVDWTNLVSAEQVAAPDDALVARLFGTGRDYARVREELLREVADGTAPPFDATLWEDADAPPVDDGVLRLEPKASSDERMHTARKQLIAKKRAVALARLLQARLALRRHRDALTDPRRALQTLETEEVAAAINIVLEALKARRAGANMLEITTCGAIAPYTRVLGGKLVALMMLSPEVGADYRAAYGAPSIISSQMRNKPVIRDNALVYLGTTSLYVHGSSQYNRLFLPPATFAPDQPRLGYAPIGRTSGFGTLQFSPATSRSIESLLTHENAFKEVNGVFGEGTSPKLRKIKLGLKILGFNPEKLMQHRQHRLIYAAPLFEGARDWLLERSTALPGYVGAPGENRDASARIVEHWRARWLAARLDHGPSLDALADEAFRFLGAGFNDEGMRHSG